MPPSQESATLPRGFRFHYQDSERPKTPEPPSIRELQQPPPPRGPRLRIKRRNVSQFSGPTEQFLASVAAADIPLPTIEIPQRAEDVDMIDQFTTPHTVTGFLAPEHSFGDTPLPRTPAPQLVTSVDEVNSKRRDWYMDARSTPDDGQARPPSSLSNPSDWSDDSYFSGGQMSRPSADSTCTSPDDDLVDPFVALSKGKGKETSNADVSTSFSSEILNGQLRSKTRGDAPWSREMSEHLWETYQVYLQDPTVTPFRIGASAVPPEGVIHRVAREAKRSWKGPKSPGGRHFQKRRVVSRTIDSSMRNVEGAGSPDTTTTSKSGSITPTGETAPKVYIQWQHSSAATRSHLRELCKRKDSLSVQKHRHLQSRSPTPFSQSRVLSRDRLRSPPTPQGAFSTRDIAISLATSTSSSMQPDGPLAKLSKPSGSGSSNEPLLPKIIVQDGQHDLSPSITSDPEFPSRRLRSPFTARTYGPSASNIFSAFSRPSPPASRSDTISSTGPRLRSPLRFKPSRSLNGTQKRRAQHALEEELSPNGAVIRPSILDEQLFGGPLENRHRRVRIRGFSLGDAASRNRIPELFRSQANGATNLSIPDMNPSNSPRQVTPLLPPAEFSRPRLGSPFSEAGTSNTFPRRLFQPMDGTSTIRKRPFATVHHTRHSIESFDFGEGPSLQSRLTQLDEKLAEIRQREAGASMSSEE
jgi:hypothetical protein